RWRGAAALLPARSRSLRRRPAREEGGGRAAVVAIAVHFDTGRAKPSRREGRWPFSTPRELALGPRSTPRDELSQTISPCFEVRELVEARAGRREQNPLARAGRTSRLADRPIEVAADAQTRFGTPQGAGYRRGIFADQIDTRAAPLHRLAQQ